jgi:hypothetical protein
MLGSAIYGGKIDVPQDSQILETYIRQIFNGGKPVSSRAFVEVQVANYT